jgi:prepilin-type N-terminal cleavage/methylation domain-containing protein
MNKSARKGFTLIEVLIALALVTTLIVGAAELMVLAVRIKIKADSNLELSDMATARLEENKSAGNANQAAFSAIGRRLASYRGGWETDGADANLIRLGFEIYPELEPEAVLTLIIFYSKDLGF